MAADSQMGTPSCTSVRVDGREEEGGFGVAGLDGELHPGTDRGSKAVLELSDDGGCGVGGGVGDVIERQSHDFALALRGRKWSRSGLPSGLLRAFW